MQYSLWRHHWGEPPDLPSSCRPREGFETEILHCWMKLCLPSLYTFRRCCCLQCQSKTSWAKSLIPALEIFKNSTEGLSIKDVRSHGRGGLSSADKERGFFRCGRPHFLEQKNLRFFEVYGVSARTKEEGGWASADKGKGVNFFAILCGRLLWATPCTSQCLTSECKCTRAIRHPIQTVNQSAFSVSC